MTRQNRKGDRTWHSAVIPALVLVGVIMATLGAASSRAEAGAVPTIAFFGFDLINSSMEATKPAEVQRIHMLDQMFDQRIDASGRFKIVPLLQDVQKDAASGPAIEHCNGCERDLAKRAGADWAAWGTVQKVSNLILNINVYIEDARSGKMEFVKSVDIRGNNDESWRHGLDYILRHYLLNAH